MAEDNVAADFRPFHIAVRLVCNTRPWDRVRAGHWILDAVHAGRVRLASNPPIPPRFELDEEELLSGLGWRDPPYQHERYSLTDIKLELNKEPDSRQHSTEVDKPSKRTGGPKSKYPWEDIATCFGIWWVTYSRLKTPDAQRAAIEEICGKLDVEIPDRRRIGEKMQAWSGACETYLEKED
jgi:hypothetical protein